MKNVLITSVLMLTLSNAFAQRALEISTGITLSPFAISTRLMESGIILSLAPFASTMRAAQARGVAGKEQLKDELVALDTEMISGSVKSIDDVRQPALKELFFEIAADEEQMESINTVIKSGSKLERIAVAVTISLLAE